MNKRIKLELTNSQLLHIITVLNKDNADLAIHENFQEKRFQDAWAYNLRLINDLNEKFLENN